jgi:biopolymer transport protein ExbB
VKAIVRDVEWAGNEIMKYLLTEYRESSRSEAVESKP